MTDLSIEEYLNEAMIEIIPKENIKATNFPETEIAEKIFSILSHRKFTYLSRKQSEKYRNRAIKKILKDIKQKKPINLYLSLGGGYHARIHPESKLLNFKPGLGEFLTLLQISRLNKKVKESYSIGITVGIIIDNLGAHFANDVSIEDTQDYYSKFCLMIRTLELNNYIRVLLESDYYSEKDYEEALNKKNTKKDISEKEIINVKRFVGLPCSKEDAICIANRYNKIIVCTRHLISKLTKEGIHLHQRENNDSPAFRSFCGGNSKIQCGEVALQIENGFVKRPILITSTNKEKYKLKEQEVKMEKIKDIIPNIFVAEKLKLS